jgi:hypothetical protein
LRGGFIIPLTAGRTICQDTSPVGVDAGLTKNYPFLFSYLQSHCASMKAWGRADEVSVDLEPLVFLSLTVGVMYFVAVALAVLSGLFYAAQHHEIGSLGVTMCTYGGVFCDNPFIVFVGAILAALWGTFVSIR